jgi:hypothetical protein
MMKISEVLPNSSSWVRTSEYNLLCYDKLLPQGLSMQTHTQYAAETRNRNASNDS